MLTRLYYGALTKRLEQLDIERHYSILIILDKAKEECNQQLLSCMLKTDKATMVRMIDYLCDKGYIKRIANPDDRRAYHIQLTAKAKKVLPRIHKAIGELNALATLGLTAKETEIFHRGLELVTGNLVNEPAHKVIVNFKKVKSSDK